MPQIVNPFEEEKLSLAHSPEEEEQLNQILEWQIQKLQAAEFYLGNYYAFVTEVIPYNFRQIRDPQVKRNMIEYGEILLDWIQTYKCMNKMCLRYKDNADLTPHYREMKKRHLCQYQHERRLVMVEHPRGTVKSAGFTKTTPAFVHAHLPEVPGGVMSAEFDRLGKKFSGSIRQIWEGLPGGRLNELYGPYIQPGKNKNWTDEKMFTAQRKDQSGEATLNCFSIDTGAGGFHLKFLVVDDPTTRANVRKFGDNWHDKVWDEFQEWYTVVDDDGILVLVYTRYGPDDLPGRIRKHLVEPAIKAKLGELPDDLDDRFPYYAKKYYGIDVLATQAYRIEDGKEKTNYPNIWSMKRVNRIRVQPQGDEWVMNQLQNRPWDRKDNPINEGVLNRIPISWDDIAPEFFRDLTIHCDTAYALPYAKDRGDESVISVWGHNGRGDVCWLWGYNGRCTKLEFARQWRRAVEWCYLDKTQKGIALAGVEPRMVTIEAPKGGDDPAAQREFLTGELHKKGIPGVTVHIKKGYDGMVGKDQKKRSIKETFGYLQDGRVTALDTLDGLPAWFHQLKHIDGGGLDDLADANKDVFLPAVYTQPFLAGNSSIKEPDHWSLDQPIQTGYYKGDQFVPVEIGITADGNDDDDFAFGGW